MDLTVPSPDPLLPRSVAKPPPKPHEPNVDLLKHRLLEKGVTPTPKILCALHKKELQKSLRKSRKHAQSQSQLHPPSEDKLSFLETIDAKYKAVAGHLQLRERPWERGAGGDLRRIGGDLEGFSGEKLKGEYLDELRMTLEERNGEKLRSLLLDDDDDVEEIVGGREGVRLADNLNEDEKIRLLVKRFTVLNRLWPTKIRKED